MISISLWHIARVLLIILGINDHKLCIILTLSSFTDPDEGSGNVLASLHWLPIKLRVDFKVLLFAYKALHNSAPDYICDLIKPYTASRSLRSSDQLFLSVPRSRCKTKGDRAFSVVAPKLWNSLPLNIRASPSLDAFKSSLKTYFYSLAFE